MHNLKSKLESELAVCDAATEGGYPAAILALLEILEELDECHCDSLDITAHVVRAIIAKHICEEPGGNDA